MWVRVPDTSWFEFQGIAVRSAAQNETLEIQLLEYDKNNYPINPLGIEMIIPSKGISNNKVVLNYNELNSAKCN